ncbi:hypothetical protein [Nocardiopsis baichengensis]|uniref:hypothetical protein n=1 Tax=Nocardiopsis baichengensis TaxID=280240 RepID=UPI00034CD0A9|nr:hypothetical protein [Nocardiopsis baichengensis]
MIHILPVGVSLRENLAKADPDPDRRESLLTREDRGVVRALVDPREKDPFSLRSRLYPNSDDKEQARAEVSTALNDPAGSGLEDQVKRFRPDLWTQRISAEMTAITRFAEGKPKRQGLFKTRTATKLRRGDTAVLAGTDTAAGLISALWNGLALADGDARRVGLLDVKSGARTGAQDAAVLIAPVPGLDASSAEEFTDAMSHLGVLGKRLIREVCGAGGDYVFHLSGGYKAALPYFIGLAEGMRGLTDMADEEHPLGLVSSVQAHILHEETAEKLISVPLRRLAWQTVRAELANVDKDKPRAAGRRRTMRPGNGHGTLYGYAYESTTGRPQENLYLTPFGEGLLELIGVVPKR